MKFFKPEDFAGIQNNMDSFMDESAAAECANKANAKLEREGKVVYADAENHPWHNVSFHDQTHKALLINIEPIEKFVDHYQDHDRETLIANMEGWIKIAEDLKQEVSNLTNANNAYKKELRAYESLIKQLQDKKQKLSGFTESEKYMFKRIPGFVPKKKCTHPKEKIRHYIFEADAGFKCECGARVQPKEFEEEK